jgi:hypothetical protein
MEEEGGPPWESEISHDNCSLFHCYDISGYQGGEFKDESLLGYSAL